MDKAEFLINASIAEWKRLDGFFHHEFRPVPPVLWFGNLRSPKPKVLVISANPSRPDLPKGNPRIPSAKNWDSNEANYNQLIKDYNTYFSHPNCATNWFGSNPNIPRSINQQGRIEDFLNGLDASFYKDTDREKKYQAIHIDLLPFSTEQSFIHIVDSLMKIDGLTIWIDNHIRELVKMIQPKWIIINGNTNFRYFNLCVNLEAQPYSIYEYNGTTIWKAAQRPNIPTIIGLSTNMGSHCRKKWNELQELGEYVSKNIVTD